MPRPHLIEHFDTPACFTLDEAVQALAKPRNTVLEEIKYLLQEDHITSVRRGLYAFNHARTGRSPDPFLVAGKVATDYVFGYHSALELHGVAQSAFYDRIFVATPERFSPFAFEGKQVRRVAAPRDLVRAGRSRLKRDGQDLSVASRELALVQCADRLRYAGGLEEVLLSVEGFPFLRWDTLEQLLDRIGKKVLYRKVGFIVDHHRASWNPPEGVLARFQQRGLGQPAYFGTRPQEGGVLVSDWDLIVPERFVPGAERHG